MAFTRQHYVEIARILRQNKTKKGIVDSLCDYFKYDNPRFQESKFRKAVAGEKAEKIY